ncbi:hypothetical protein [Streptomyces sp. 351MFTsu5.1]|uniref:hypothetical protein n=1 Tax=Streptomyces sp. 351MFTsu5.1 TaxID=1172180 RepID=UPI00048B519E|nr:hypothetical protein [Streptomyces sp. 351MFTsu5.1]
MSAGRWAAGGGAVVVLVATGAWARLPGGTGVDAGLWSRVRPAVEARLLEQPRGTGVGEPGARWFCRAEAVDLAERDGLVRAGVSTLCVEYGVRSGRLVECSGAEVPQVIRLRREADGDYGVVSQETAPDGEGNAQWITSRFGHVTAASLDDTVSSTALESAARTHFNLPTDTPVTPC